MSDVDIQPCDENSEGTHTGCACFIKNLEFQINRANYFENMIAEIYKRKDGRKLFIAWAKKNNVEIPKEYQE